MQPEQNILFKITHFHLENPLLFFDHLKKMNPFKKQKKCILKPILNPKEKLFDNI